VCVCVCVFRYALDSLGYVRHTGITIATSNHTATPFQVLALLGAAQHGTDATSCRATRRVVC